MILISMIVEHIVLFYSREYEKNLGVCVSAATLWLSKVGVCPSTYSDDTVFKICICERNALYTG